MFVNVSLAMFLKCFLRFRDFEYSHVSHVSVFSCFLNLCFLKKRVIYVAVIYMCFIFRKVYYWEDVYWFKSHFGFFQTLVMNLGKRSLVIVIWIWVTYTAQKIKFPLKISSVNVTKSPRNCRFGQVYWRNT